MGVYTQGIHSHNLFFFTCCDLAGTAMTINYSEINKQQRIIEMIRAGWAWVSGTERLMCLVYCDPSGELSDHTTGEPAIILSSHG